MTRAVRAVPTPKVYPILFDLNATSVVWPGFVTPGYDSLARKMNMFVKEPQF